MRSSAVRAFSDQATSAPARSPAQPPAGFHHIGGLGEGTGWFRPIGKCSSEPFIVFENPPTEAIDRRALPTIDLEDQAVDQVDIYASDLAADGTLELDNLAPTLGLVSEGAIELRIDNVTTERLAAGASFALPTDGSQATIVNASSEAPAKVITFLLR